MSLHAFRARGIGIAAYFSKPDWHCPWYWAPGMDKPVAADRNPTYKPAEHPELWEKFIEYTRSRNSANSSPRRRSPPRA